MIFIDGDEFVYPLSQFSLAGKSLVEFLPTAIFPHLSPAPPGHLRQNCNSSVSHLAVQSRMYGSSGMADKVAGELTLETYRRYSNYVSNNAGERRMVHKIIGNTDCVRNMATHYPTRIAPLKSVSWAGEEEAS